MNKTQKENPFKDKLAIDRDFEDGFRQGRTQAQADVMKIIDELKIDLYSNECRCNDCIAVAIDKTKAKLQSPNENSPKSEELRSKDNSDTIQEAISEFKEKLKVKINKMEIIDNAERLLLNQVKAEIEKTAQEIK